MDNRSCAIVCATDQDCGAGLFCLPAGNLYACQCDPSRCGPRQICVSPTLPCENVPCSDSVPCESPTDYCVLRRCYPLDGDCRSGGVCPTLEDPSILTTCQADQGLCTRQLAPVVLLANVPTLDVGQPAPGTVFPGGTEPSFAWEGAYPLVILLVLQPKPDWSGDFATTATWGAALPAGINQARWGDGHSIQNGTWLSGQPGPVGDGIFYLQAQAFDTGSLVAASALLPFAVGASPWRTAGDLCSSDDECSTPSAPMVCRDGFCKRQCASHLLDCGADGFCAAPDATGVRVCAI
ncbi:MAG: hypothetical protein JW940_19905 [Polyangiaceae bacterium]|nr:hypothetical protein [Polyangiaceae bacterium]